MLEVCKLFPLKIAKGTAASSGLLQNAKLFPICINYSSDELQLRPFALSRGTKRITVFTRKNRVSL
jgi:hypothetical protein